MNIKSNLPALGCALALFGFLNVSSATANQAQTDVKSKQSLIGKKEMAHKQRQTVKNKYIIQLDSTPLIQAKREATPVAKASSLSHSQATSRQVSSYRVMQQAQSRQRIDIKYAAVKKDKSAQVFAEYDFVLNGVALETNLSLEQVRALPNVKAAYPVETYSAKLDHALPLIKAYEAWDKVGGQSMAGKGIKIAIIDSGINPDNAMFRDSGMEAPASKATDDYCAEVPSFCNNKLITARFYPPASTDDDEFDSPQALSGHGSHVAGIATGREVVTDTGETVVGVAPGAYLMVYKALWGQDGNGDSAGLLGALNDAAKDGAHVINNSWGSDAGGSPNNSIYKTVFEELEASNIVVVSAAGNEGELGPKSIGCPGCIESGITVASTTTDIIAGYILEFGSNKAVSLPGEGFIDGTTFNARGVLASDEDQLGCSAWSAGSLTNRVAIVNRGTCTFSEKAGFAQQAGASAIVVINNVPGALVRMQLDDSVTIPAVFVSDVDGARILDFLDSNSSGSFSMNGRNETSSDPDLADIVSGFSSIGPNGDDGFIKPDMSAPGDLILSATSPDDEISIDLDYVYLGGTSMATPMVSGAAALLKQYDNDLTAVQIKNILINSVDNGVTDTTDTRLATAFETGSGRLNIERALELTTYAETPNLANNKCFILCRVSNKLITMSSTSDTWSGEVEMFSELAKGSVSPFVITLDADNQEADYTVNFELPLDAAPGWYFGQLVWTSSTGQTLTQAIAISQGDESSNKITLIQTGSGEGTESYRLETTNLTSENSFKVELDAIGGAEFDVDSVQSPLATSIEKATSSIVVNSNLAPGAFTVSNDLPIDIDLSDAALNSNLVVCSSGCDEFTFELPFEFEYFGESQSKLTVSENGLLIIGSSVSASSNLSNNRDVPAEAEVKGVVAPFWTDFDLDDASDSSAADTGGGSLYYLNYSDNGKEYLVIQWHEVQLWISDSQGFGADYWGVTDPNVAFTFQVIVEKGTDNIWFNYMDIQEQPNYYTVGLESPDSSIGYSYWFNGQGESAVTSATGGIIFDYQEAESLVVDFSINNVEFDSEFAVNDNVSVEEDGSVTVSVLDNDLTGDRAGIVSRVGDEGRLTNVFVNEDDFSIDSASLTLDSEPTKGTVTINSGKFTYEPNEDYFGTDSFDYSVTNSNGRKSTASVNVMVTPVNDAPVITALNVPSSITEGSTITLSATGFDVDSEIVFFWNLPDGFTTENTSGDFIVGQEIEVTYTSSNATSGVITVSITDGEVEVSEEATIKLNKQSVVAPVTTPAKKSGGSSSPMMILMVFALLFIKRAQLLNKLLIRK
ncbi:S8 family serine peptidase [Psychrosphaera haliotis]|nr:S8 family serine peptidase [Psychrosphaera haliotis]